jgi:hypothetical protein
MFDRPRRTATLANPSLPDAQDPQQLDPRGSNSVRPRPRFRSRLRLRLRFCRVRVRSRFRFRLRRRQQGTRLWTGPHATNVPLSERVEPSLDVTVLV